MCFSQVNFKLQVLKYRPSVDHVRHWGSVQLSKTKIIMFRLTVMINLHSTRLSNRYMTLWKQLFCSRNDNNIFKIYTDPAREHNSLIQCDIVPEIREGAMSQTVTTWWQWNEGRWGERGGERERRMSVCATALWSIFWRLQLSSP